MARVTIFLIVAATMLFLYYDNDGKNDVIPQPPPHAPPDDKDQQWQDFVSIREAFGYEVLSVAASQKWIEEHSDEISIPNQIAFGETHVVTELPFIGTVITVDANDKRRVITSILVPPPPPAVPDGYLDEKESLEWLSENGYEVKKTSDGSITIKKHVQTGNINDAIQIGGNSKIVVDGKIYIEDER